ncbi:CU044_5270 family protein [Streptomyces sp. Qhu-G9]|uniref:CU044_5270 family protein n=1 Tax=Streptomyces sp. Qhu-G9 TaxID=3452799 RepID=UPI0022AC0E36|nr:CU044_5270 family protein [Streptomyces aurantiacus]WAU78736.1 CU044_5270 family protein [Streptomyces aurantiacus]
MNPEEREELARLLPSPGEPVLTSDRHDLLKDLLMKELTEQAPELLDTATAPGRRARVPRRRFAAIAVPLATAAAIVAAVLVGGVGSETATNATTDADAVDLLNRIAEVAAAKKSVAVRDDQYVYVRTQGSMKFSEKDIRVLREASWTAVDGKRPGLRRVTVLVGPPFRHRDPFSSYSKGTHDMRLSPDPNITTFRELQALPTAPDSLLEKIYADTKGEGQTRESAALERIGDMLPDATLLPELDAALYRAAAKIPGVSVIADAKDYTGRSGIGLSFKERDGRTVWVFDKESLDFLGSADEALLDVGVADRAGETPAA